MDKPTLTKLDKQSLPMTAGGETVWHDFYPAEQVDALVGALISEKATAQNELCTASDQIPPDMDGDSLSVALIKLKDQRHDLHQSLAAKEASIIALQDAEARAHVICKRVMGALVDSGTVAVTVPDDGDNLVAGINQIIHERDTLQAQLERVRKQLYARFEVCPHCGWRDGRKGGDSCDKER